MKNKRFIWLVAFVFCTVLTFNGQAVANISYEFRYDRNVSPSRNKAAQYAYEIFNYEWQTDKKIRLYGSGGTYLADYATGTIRGVPYALHHNIMSFAEFKSENTDRSESTGMVCATLVTECIMQGFSKEDGLNISHTAFFHKTRYTPNWHNYISSASEINNSSSGIWKYDHTEADWTGLVNKIYDYYDACSKLRRGDYLNNFNHVVLVIDNDGSKIKFIDSTTPTAWSTACTNKSADGRICGQCQNCRDNMIGTHIGECEYSTFKSNGYVPMYVTYPDDDLVIHDTWIKIDEAHFPDLYFRAYVKNFDNNDDGYFSDSEIEAVTSFGWVGGPHPDNNPYNSEATGTLIQNGNLWAKIKSIEGVKYFKNLEWLYVYNDKIENIDVSGMTKLGDLRCYGNKITSINAYGCTSLWNLEAYDNELTSIQLADCPKLQKLNISNNTKLTSLSCTNCSLTSLLVNNCTSLSYIDCSGNSNVQLALNGCSSLEKLIRDSSVNVRGSAPVFTTTNLPDAKVNTYYSQYINATGQTASGTPSVFYRIRAMRRTLNLSINKTTGLLSGTPTEAVNNADLTIEAYNYVGSTQQSLPVNVLPVVTPPTITTSNTTTIEAITKQSSFRQGNNTFTGFTATGENVTWSLSGNLPAGLGLNSSTGKFTGTPNYTENGKTSWKGVTYNFSVTATNNGGSDTKSFTMNLFESPIITTTAGTLKDGYVDDKYTTEINATGSNYYMGWKLDSGSFPDGLDFDSNNMSSGSLGSRTAIITGTPTRAGSYPFTLKVAAGSLWGIGLSPRPGEYATKNFTIQIADKPVINGSFTSGMVGVEYSSTVEVKGGFSSYSWTYSGTLPTGLKVLRNGSKFTLYSTPTKEGNYPFTLTVSDKNGKTNTKTFNISIAPAGIAVNSTNFPDANFRSYVNNFDKDGNGYLSDSEIASVKTINVAGKNISNLKGIQLFTNLEELVCSNNSLTTLDLSGNNNLKALYCSNNKLTSLNLSGNRKLETLECDNNQLTALDVSKNTALDYISCIGNKLTKLDVSSNTALKYLYCNDNQLTELTLGNNSVLQEVNCKDNSSLTTLDIQGCSKLLANNNVLVDAGLTLITGEELPEFGNSTLVLDGKIGVNFYVYLPEIYNPEECYMVFESRRGISNENPTEKYNPEFYSMRNGKKYYAYTCYINSAQMAEEITATLYFNGRTISKKDSVDAYLNRAKQHESELSDNVNNLMKAIRNYGHYVQPMLSISGNWTIGDKYAEMPRASEITVSDIEEAKTNLAQYAKVEYKNSVGIEKDVFSLNLDTETIINVYSIPAATYNGRVSVTVDGQSFEVKEDYSSGSLRYKTEIKNITAPDLNKAYTVFVEANGINMIQVSALSYAQAVLSTNITQIGNVPIDVMKQAVTALYKYHVTAKAYMDGGKR